MTYIHEKNQRIETDTEMTWMTELVEKNLKIVIINIFLLLKKIGESMGMKKRETEDREKRSKLNF